MKAIFAKFLQPGPHIDGQILQTATVVGVSVPGSALCESMTVEHDVLTIVLAKPKDSRLYGHGVNFSVSGRVDFWVPAPNDHAEPVRQSKPNLEPVPKH